MAEAPAKEFSADIKELGDKIVSLTIKQAQDLVDYLKATYNIEPAGGAVMMAGPAAGGAAAEEKAEPTAFDVILKGAGDKKIQVIKVVRAATQPRPEGSQGPGGRRAEDREGKPQQGRGRQAGRRAEGSGARR